MGFRGVKAEKEDEERIEGRKKVHHLLNNIMPAVIFTLLDKRINK